MAEEKSPFDIQKTGDGSQDSEYIKWLKETLGKLVAKGSMTLQDYEDTIRITQEDIAKGVPIESLTGYNIYSLGNRFITDRYVAETVSKVEKEKATNPWLQAREKIFGGFEAPSVDTFKAIAKVASEAAETDAWNKHYAKLAEQQATSYMAGRSAASFDAPPKREPNYSETTYRSLPAPSQDVLDPFISQFSSNQQNFWQNKRGEVLQPMQQARQAWWDEIIRLRKNWQSDTIVASKDEELYGGQTPAEPKYAKDPLQEYLANFDFNTKFLETPRYQRGEYPRFFAPPAKWG